MSLTLRTITFRHDPTDPTVSALCIRRNKDFEVAVPEYDSATPPATPAESTAAYALGPTTGNPVRVVAQFTVPTPTTAIFEIKARGGGVLGRIRPQQVAFAGGTTASVEIPLDHRRFSAIGRHDARWRWWFRPLGAPTWQPLVTTSHRIYITLDVPVAPWNQLFADRRNPWTDLLDQCCTAASGARTAEKAAVHLTKRINGDFGLKYDIRWGAPRYGFGATTGSFRLTEWLDYVVRGQAPILPAFCPGDPHEYPDFRIVNCYDCAAALTIMADLLGVPLGYHFHQPFGYLEYVVPIGRSKCNNPFPGCTGTNFAVGPDDTRTAFGNHAYPKLSGGGNYDACMREWVPWWKRALLIWVWALVFGLTLGLVDLQALRLRAGGWLVDLSQAGYGQRTIDVSEPFEAGAASGGGPTPVAVDFQAT